MRTAMQELIEYLENIYYVKEILDWEDIKKNIIQKEKEQIQKAFSDGQETPINHPTLPHYSREEYYDDNYKSETI